MTSTFLFTIAAIVAAEPAQVKRAHFGVACVDDLDAKALLDLSGQKLKDRGWQVTFDIGKARCFLDERRRARELLKRARKSFEGMLFADAKRDVEAVVGIFDAAESTLGALDLLVEARVLLGWISLEGDGREAKEHFRVVKALAPDFVPDKKIYPPPVLEALEAAGASLRGRHGRVNLESEPAGSTVLLDGRERCQTPCAVEEVPEGTHFLELRADEHLSDYRLISVARASEQHLGVTLQKPEPRRLKSAVSVALASSTDGAHIVATFTGAGTPDALTLDTTDREGSAGKVVESVLRASENTVVLTSATPAFYERWWFWGIVAAGAVGVVTTAVVLSGGDTARVVVVPP